MTRSRSESFDGEVTKDGIKRVKFDDADGFREWVASFAGKRVTVTVGPVRHPRTIRQHNWWKRTVRLLGDEVGYDRDEIDVFEGQLLYECFGAKFDERFGRDVPNVARLSMTDTVECSEAIDWLPRFAARKYGIEIKLPNEP